MWDVRSEKWDVRCEKWDVRSEGWEQNYHLNLIFLVLMQIIDLEKQKRM